MKNGALAGTSFLFLDENERRIVDFHESVYSLRCQTPAAGVAARSENPISFRRLYPQNDISGLASDLSVIFKGGSVRKRETRPSVSGLSARVGIRLSGR